MVERLSQSLAFRLAAQYTVVFGLGAAVLFAGLYWVLADAVEAREHAAVEQLVDQLGQAYDVGGAGALRARLNSNATPEVRAFFVRVTTVAGETLFASVPPDWIETQIQRIPVPGVWGLAATQEVHTIRIPQNALRDYAIATRPLADGNRIEVGRSTDSRAVLLQPLRRAFAFAGAGAVMVALSVGTFLAWRATRPLRQVAATTRRILETGDLSARVPDPEGAGELATLVRQLNSLLGRNAAHVRVLRDTLDNLAHDLRTPLTRLRGAAEMALQDGGDPAGAREALAECVDESDHLLHLLEALLDISAAEGGALRLDRQPHDLCRLVRRSADLYREVAEEKRITVQLDLPAALNLRADALRLGQVINNLLDNALKYTPEGGRVTLTTATRGTEAILTVVDNGPGVPPAEREAVFRRLYRSDSSRSQRGLGLGLSLVKAIVESHGGNVGLDEAPGGGARFTLQLPLGTVPAVDAPQTV